MTTNTTILLLVLLLSISTAAQDCDIDKGKESIFNLNEKGEFEAAMSLSDSLLKCPSISSENEIELYTWQFVLNRNLLKEKKANEAILKAREIRTEKNLPGDFEFRMLLVESSALRGDTIVYNPMLEEIRKIIFNSEENENHLYKGRYYFLINYKEGDAFGNLVKALHHFDQLDSIPVFHKGVTLRALGNMSRTRGDFEKSKEYYQRELKIYRDQYPDKHFNVSICNYNLGNIHYEMLEYELALEHYLKVVPVWTERYEKDHRLMKNLNEAIGDMYWELGDYENALVYFNSSVVNEEVINNDVSEVTIKVADSALQTGNYNNALNYYKEAFAWRELTYGKNHTLTAACQNFVGRAIRASGDTEAALNTYQQAIAKLASGVDPDDWYANPDSETEIKSHQYLLESMMAKGELLKELYAVTNDEKDLITAMETQSAAVDILESMKQGRMSESSKLFWTQRTLSLVENSIDTALKLHYLTGKNDFLKLAFEFSERSKALLLLATFDEYENTEFANIPKDVLLKEQQLRFSITEYMGKLESEEKRCAQVRDKMLTLFKNKLEKLQAEYDILMNTMEKDYPDYFHLKFQPQLETLGNIQKALSGESEALVSYFFGEEHGYVFRVSSSDITVRKISNLNNVKEQVAQLFSSLKDSDNFRLNPQKAFESYKTQAEALYEFLLKDELSTRNYSKLVIVPDGILAYLPFEILLTEKTASIKRNYRSLPYLINTHSVSYSPSASIFSKSAQQKNRYDAYLGFAPSYETQATGALREPLSNLVYNASEVEFAANLFDGKSYIGGSVSEEKLKNNAENAGIIHLAMHGKVEDEHPLLSKLYFSPSDSEDGILHTYEIYNLTINSQLVILSACNTASGKLERGEGILSLERAFQYAGSRSLLSTLWAVDDAASAQLTQSFLTHLKEGMPKDKALQQAKLAYLKTATPENLHPYFWSSFRLTGNTQQLESGFNRIFLWLGVAVALVIGLVLARKRKQAA